MQRRAFGKAIPLNAFAEPINLLGLFGTNPQSLELGKEGIEIFSPFLVCYLLSAGTALKQELRIEDL
jgi:hypothetical protein